MLTHYLFQTPNKSLNGIYNNIVLNLQKVGPQSVMFVTNNTTPSLPVQKRDIDWTMANVTLERAVRWAEQPPEPRTPKGYVEEKVARFALYTLNAALKPVPKNCMLFALCWSNKFSRNLQGQQRYWLPIWR